MAARQVAVQQFAIDLFVLHKVATSKVAASQLATTRTLVNRVAANQGAANQVAAIVKVHCTILRVKLLAPCQGCAPLDRSPGLCNGAKLLAQAACRLQPSDTLL